MKFNLVIEIDEHSIKEHLEDNPSKTKQELERDLVNACYLGGDCIEAIIQRQFSIVLEDHYITKE
jgi:hypothetical protein